MKIKNIFVIAFMASVLTSCDEHEVEDYSWNAWQPGMVYATNGEVSSFDKCMADGNTPEAVLFYVDRNGETDAIAYAVTLMDCSTAAFSNPDTTYIAQNTSADYTTLDGETNTTTLRYGTIESPSKYNHGISFPLLQKCISSMPQGQ